MRIFLINKFQWAIPYIQRDVRGQTINFIPFAFNPVKKTLKVYNKIRIKINFDTKLVGQNELISPKAQKSFIRNKYNL